MKKILLSLFVFSTMVMAKEKVTIVYPMESPTEIKISEELKKVAKEKYDIEIEYVGVTNAELENKFLIMERTKNNADMVVIQDITNVKEYLEPVDSFKTEYNFNKGAVAYFSDKGEMLAIPVGTVAYGFMGNNVHPKTLKDLEGLRTSIPNGTERHAFRNFYIYALAHGIGPLDVDSPKFKETLEFYKKVNVQKTHMNDKYPDMFKQYAENKVDFIHTGTYHISNQEPWGLENLKTSTPFIVGENSYIGVSGIAISSSSKHKEAAKKVAKLYMEKEIITPKFLDMDLPAYELDVDYSSLGADKERIKKAWIEISMKGITLPKIENQAKIEKVYRDNLILFIEGKQDADATIASIKKHINN
ncbi:MAG: ABC transporter substrate-binding protein [Cetobacterium sp.]